MADSTKLNELNWGNLAELTLSDIGGIATAVAAFLAFCAAIIAAWQLLAAKYEARNSLVKSNYKDYLRLAFEFPRFSSPSYPTTNPPYYAIESNPAEFERYEFYVSYLLFAAEEILDFKRNDEIWREVLKDQLRYHALYLKRVILKSNYKNHYSKSMCELIEQAVNSYKPSSGF